MAVCNLFTGLLSFKEKNHNPWNPCTLMAKNSTVFVRINKPPSCAAKQRFSHLCCQAVVKPGAHSFKIRSGLQFDARFTACVEANSKPKEFYKQNLCTKNCTSTLASRFKVGYWFYPFLRFSLCFVIFIFSLFCVSCLCLISGLSSQ